MEPGVYKEAEKTKFPVGEHRGQTLGWILDHDPMHLNELARLDMEGGLEPDFSEALRTLLDDDQTAQLIYTRSWD